MISDLLVYFERLDRDLSRRPIQGRMQTGPRSPSFFLPSCVVSTDVAVIPRYSLEFFGSLALFFPFEYSSYNTTIPRYFMLVVFWKIGHQKCFENPSIRI
jgi:hypothetical protein